MVSHPGILKDKNPINAMQVFYRFTQKKYPGFTATLHVFAKDLQNGSCHNNISEALLRTKMSSHIIINDVMYICT